MKDPFVKLLELSEEELRKDVVEGKKTLMSFRFQAGSGSVKPHEVKAVRRRIARLKTALKTKARQGQGD